MCTLVFCFSLFFKIISFNVVQETKLTYTLYVCIAFSVMM